MFTRFCGVHFEAMARRVGPCQPLRVAEGQVGVGLHCVMEAQVALELVAVGDEVWVVGTVRRRGSAEPAALGERGVVGRCGR